MEEELVIRSWVLVRLELGCGSGLGWTRVVNEHEGLSRGFDERSMKI